MSSSILGLAMFIKVSRPTGVKLFAPYASRKPVTL